MVPLEAVGSESGNTRPKRQKKRQLDDIAVDIVRPQSDLYKQGGSHGEGDFSKGRGERVTKACNYCRDSKLKCDEARPCHRCRHTDRASTCVDAPSRKQTSATTNTNNAHQQPHHVNASGHILSNTAVSYHQHGASCGSGGNTNSTSNNNNNNNTNQALLHMQQVQSATVASHLQKQQLQLQQMMKLQQQQHNYGAVPSSQPHQHMQASTHINYGTSNANINNMSSNTTNTTTNNTSNNTNGAAPWQLIIQQQQLAPSPSNHLHSHLHHHHVNENSINNASHTNINANNNSTNVSYNLTHSPQTAFKLEAHGIQSSHFNNSNNNSNTTSSNNSNNHDQTGTTMNLALHPSRSNNHANSNGSNRSNSTNTGGGMVYTRPMNNIQAFYNEFHLPSDYLSPLSKSCYAMLIFHYRTYLPSNHGLSVQQYIFLKYILQFHNDLYNLPDDLVIAVEYRVEQLLNQPNAAHIIHEESQYMQSTDSDLFKSFFFSNIASILQELFLLHSSLHLIANNSTSTNTNNNTTNNTSNTTSNTNTTTSNNTNNNININATTNSNNNNNNNNHTSNNTTSNSLFQPASLTLPQSGFNTNLVKELILTPTNNPSHMNNSNVGSGLYQSPLASTSVSSRHKTNGTTTSGYFRMFPTSSTNNSNNGNGINISNLYNNCTNNNNNNATSPALLLPQHSSLKTLARKAEDM